MPCSGVSGFRKSNISSLISLQFHLFLSHSKTWSHDQPKEKRPSSHFVNKAGSFLVQEKGGERDDKKEAKNVVASAAAVADT